MRAGLEQIRVTDRHPPNGFARTNPGNGTFVAVQAAILLDLEKERAVAEPITALDAFRAPDAQVLRRSRTRNRDPRR